MQGTRAISDPVRREILELVRVAPMPAGSIANHFSISRPAISKHLGVLIECGVVEVTIVGRRRLYALRREPLIEVADYLGQLLAPSVSERLDALETEVMRTKRDRRTASSASEPHLRGETA
ncbi:ArsR/SmtB family transcription factor [Microbacterium sp. PMB16]|uniref:ArsR/SmtB family transcription factor n=1 Tax=Microbacterium sp. PMB16 TaxID=3120157 RepID=UPI003F4B9767